MLCGCCVMHVCAGRMTAPPLSQRYLSYGKVICGGHSPIFDDHYSYTRTWQAVSRRKLASTRSITCVAVTSRTCLSATVRFLSSFSAVRLYF